MLQLLADVGDMPVWVTGVIQLGSLGILGYHLLWGLPAMQREFFAVLAKRDQAFFEECAADRKVAEERNERLAKSLESMAQFLPHFCRGGPLQPPPRRGGERDV